MTVADMSWNVKVVVIKQHWCRAFGSNTAHMTANTELLDRALFLMGNITAHKRFAGGFHRRGISQNSHANSLTILSIWLSQDGLIHFGCGHIQAG
jgi:hypothetical protein